MTRQHATAVAGHGRRLTKSLTVPAGRFAAVLTYPVPDLQNDYVVPDGGDWSAYPLDPVVNWEHEVPVGRGAVEMRAVTLPEGEFVVPVGTTQFFESAKCLKGLSLNRYDAAGRVVGRWEPTECLETAAQARRLVDKDLVTGVSLEFEPVKKEKIGKSLLAKRDAYRFHVWKGLGWAHTATPVNDSARLLDRAEKAVKFLTATPGVLPGVIRKSLAAMARDLTSRPTLVRGGWAGGDTPRLKEADMARVRKAAGDMPDMPADDLTPPELGDGMADAPDAGGPTPAVKTLLDGSQMLMDLCGQVESGMGQSEHMKAKKYAAGICDKLKKLAGEMSDMADKVQAELGGDGDEPEPADDAPEPDTDDDTGEVMAKAFPRVAKAFPAFKPRRLKAADLRPVAKVSKAGSPPADTVTVSKADWDAMQEAVRLATVLADH